MTSFAVELHTRTRSMRLYTHDRGDFASLRNQRILVYWPHGLGDFVAFSYVLPLLEHTNMLWITRFGDDSISVMDNNNYVTPIFVGGLPAAQSRDGESLNVRHMGMSYGTIDGGKQKVLLPRSAFEVCRRHRINTLLWTSFPETWGTQPFPYHSKARNLARHIVPPSSRPVLESKIPLTNSINFSVAPWLSAWVEARLRNVLRLGERKLCLISRNGYTSTGKNWGHSWREDMPETRRREGEECRDFMRLLLKKDRRWSFLAMEDRLFEKDDTLRSRELHCYSFAEVFGPASSGTLPFGLILKAIVNFASLSVGVPTGPFHVSMVKRDLPTIGIWIEHSPIWYDEPKDCAIHLVGSEALHRDPRVLSQNCEVGSLAHRIIALPTRIIPGEQVLSAVESLLQGRH